MLKETGSISKKEANMMRNTQQALQSQINKLNEDNKNIMKKFKEKELEALKATKKIAELTDQLNGRAKEMRFDERKTLDSRSTSSKVSYKLKKNSSELFLSKWEDNENNDEIRVELLNNFIHSAELRLDLFK